MGLTQSLPARPRYHPPRPIEPNDRVESFDCGKIALDDWLKVRAIDNEGSGSRTYVVTAASGPDAGAVVGYYTLASGAVLRQAAPGKLRRNMPDPLPVLVLGRMAVDRRHQGQRLGAAMMREAMLKAAQVSAQIGLRALMVHAIDDDALPFYLRWGFKPFPPSGLTMFLPIETIIAAL